MAIVINSTTGEIDLDQTTPGTYVVTYTVQGVSSTQDVTVNAVDNAGFSYSASSYEPTDADPTPTITGLTGGTFSGTTGLVINSTTGEIDLSASTVATHTITYDTTSSGSSVCPNTSTQTVEIALAGIANNYSMRLDGASSDYIDANVINLPQGNSNFSVSCWFKRSSSNGNYGAIVSFGTAALRQQFYLNFAIGGSNLKFGFYQEDYSTGLFATNSTDWYNAIVIFDNSIGTYGTAKLYINGNLEKTFALTGTLNITGSSLNLGRTSTYYYTGLIDEVGIWNTALTDGTGGTVNQIAEIYNGTSTNLTKDLTTVSGSNLIYWNRMGD